MKVTEKDVAYVADLANLELSAEERAALARDLNSILGYIDGLNQLDTGKVEAMLQVRVSERHLGDDAPRGSAHSSAMREDIKEGLRKSLPHEAAMQNAPDSDGKFFELPKVIER